MRIVCAWCEKEGRPAVIRVDDSAANFDSHGICDAHSVKVLSELRSRLKQTWQVGPTYLDAATAVRAATMRTALAESPTS